MKKVLFSLMIMLISFLSLAKGVVKEIELKGNKKTKSSVILNEIDLKKGDLLNKDSLKEARSKLLNLEIFSDVKINLVNDVLKITVVERWTAVPILKFNSGGGVSEIVAGLYDVNFMGNFIEAGAQYQRLGDRHSGVIWTKFPRLTDKLQLDVQAWKTSRIRIKYNQKAEEAIVNNGFTQTRDKLYLGLNYRKKYDEILGLFYEYNKDEFDNDLDFDSFSNSEVILPESSKFHFLGFQYIYGRVNIEREMFEGQRLTAMMRFAFSMKETENFQEAFLNYEYFKRIGKKSNFAFRSFLGANTNTKSIQYRLYFGGLETIRGFKDNRFSGNVGFYTNLEWRESIYQSDSLILQPVAFADFVSTAEKANGFLKSNAMSMGGGLRAILPRFYRLVFRLDFASPIEKSGDETISFGIRQFF